MAKSAGCYAAPLGGGDDTMTGGNVGSEAVPRDLVSSRTKRMVAVDGHTWQRRPRQPVGIGRLKAKILCRNHNGALSPFDSTMRAFGEAVTECMAHVWRRDVAPHRTPTFEGGHL